MDKTGRESGLTPEAMPGPTKQNQRILLASYRKYLTGSSQYPAWGGMSVIKMTLPLTRSKKVSFHFAQQ